MKYKNQILWSFIASFSFILFFSLITSAQSCSDGSASYDDDILPILSAKCGGCHTTQSISGFNISTYAGLLAGGTNCGPGVTPGNGTAAASSIIDKTQHVVAPTTASCGDNMPTMGTPLTATEYGIIQSWIVNGAQESCPPDSVAVTFNVNTNCSDFSNDPSADTDVAANFVGITGPTFGWCGGCANMEDLDGDGIYSITINFLPGEVLEYKYQLHDNNGNWVNQEQLVDNAVAGESCAPVTDFNGFANRQITIGSNDTIIDNFFGYCSDPGVDCLGCTDPTASNYNSTATVDDGSCMVPVPSYDVTFCVDMNCNNDGNYVQPYLVGPFVGWNGTALPMSDDGMTGGDVTAGDQIWCTIYTLEEGDWEFKLTADNYAYDDPLIPGMPCTITSSGFTNRLISVSSDTTIQYAYASCAEDCSAPVMNYDVTFCVDMNCNTDSIATPSVFGSFNGWDPFVNPLVDDGTMGDMTAGDGIWCTVITIAEATYEYKFLQNADESEQLVPGAPCTNSSGGYTNRVLVLSSDTTVMYAYATCDPDCNSLAPTFDVTFQVNMCEAIDQGIFDPATQSVFTTGGNANQTGNFASCGDAMTDADGDGIYEITNTYPDGFLVIYKYFIGGYAIAGTDACSGGDAYNFGYEILGPNDACAFGNYFDRNHTVSMDETLAPVCFSSCSDCVGCGITACQDTLDLTGTSPDYAGSGVYSAINVVISDDLIPSGDVTEMHAGSYVDLVPGFDAQAGCDFEAYIAPCVDPAKPAGTVNPVQKIQTQQK